MDKIIERSTFENAYAGKAPWDIGKPQKPFVAAADQIASPVLDAGCGTGDTALFLASHGLKVVGLDFIEEAIQRAKKKAADRKLYVDFRHGDALKLSEWKERFASVTDSGLFHVFSDADRPRYVQGLAHVVQPGGRLFLMCFSDEEPGADGPRRIARKELDEAFANGWQIESVQAVRFETNPEFKEMTFSPGGPKAWFAIIRRKG